MATRVEELNGFKKGETVAYRSRETGVLIQAVIQGFVQGDAGEHSVEVKRVRSGRREVLNLLSIWKVLV